MPNKKKKKKKKKRSLFKQPKKYVAQLGEVNYEDVRKNINKIHGENPTVVIKETVEERKARLAQLGFGQSKPETHSNGKIKKNGTEAHAPHYAFMAPAQVEPVVVEIKPKHSARRLISEDFIQEIAQTAKEVQEHVENQKEKQRNMLVEEIMANARKLVEELDADSSNEEQIEKFEDVDLIPIGFGEGLITGDEITTPEAARTESVKHRMVASYLEVVVDKETGKTSHIARLVF